MKKSFFGVLLALLTGLLWALSSPVSKLIGANGVDMTTVVFCRILLTAIVLGGWLGLRSPSQLALRKGEGVKLFFFSLLGPTGLYLGFMLSVVYLPITTAMIVHYTFPLVTALGSSFFTGERPSRYELMGSVLIVIGVCFSVLRNDWTLDTQISLPGLFWGVLAVLGLAGQTLLGRASVTKGGISGMGMFFYTHLFGVFWIALYKTLTSGWGDLLLLTPFHWGLVFAPVLFSSILGYSAYYTALKYVSASAASLLASIEIPSAVLMTSLIAQVWPTRPSLVGCVFIFASIAMAALTPKAVRQESST